MFSFIRICNFTTYVLIYLPLKCNWISIIRSYLAWPNKAFYWENGTLGAASISPFHLQKNRSNGLVTFRFFHTVGLPVFLMHNDVSFGGLEAMESTKRFSKGEEFASLLYVISLGYSAFVEHMKNRRGIVWISLKENKPWWSVRLSFVPSFYSASLVYTLSPECCNPVGLFWVICYWSPTYAES